MNKSVPEPLKIKSPDPALPGNYLERKPFVILLVLTLVIVLVVFKDFLLLNKVYLFKDIGSDTTNIFYPQFVHLTDYLKNAGIPKWSFHQGMGQNIYPFSLGDPAVFLYYLIGESNIPYGIVFIEAFKILLAVILCFQYLKLLDLSGFAAIAGSLLFSFSGFMILGGSWYIFSYEALLAIFLLYAFEKLFKQGVWYLLPIPIALMGAYQPFYLFMYGIFLFVYMIVRFIDERGFDLKKLTSFILKVIGLGILGVLLSSVFLFANMFQLLQSPRVGGDASFFKTLSSKPVFGFADVIQYYSIVLRFFSNDLLGTGSKYRGWLNYLESPIHYCGLVSILLVPQFFTFLDRRRKIIYFTVAALCFVPLVFPYFRYMFWAFTGDYFRTFSLIISFFLIFLTVHSLQYITSTTRLNIKVLIASLILVLMILFFPVPGKFNLINKELRMIIAMFFVIYAVIIFLMGLKKYQWLAKLSLLFVLCFELIYLSSVTVNSRRAVVATELKQKIGYNDPSVEALAFINSVDKGFFRITKDYGSGLAGRSWNDGMIQKYNGTSSYNSFNQKHYIEFLQGMDIAHPGKELETRWAVGVTYRPLLQTVSSIKYALSVSAEDSFTAHGYDYLASFGEVRVFKNKHFLPLGYTYPSYITADDFSRLSNFQKDKTLLKAVVIGEDGKNLVNGLPQVNIGDTITGLTGDEYDKLVSNLRKDTLAITEHSQNVIKGSIDVGNKEILFFSIPYDKGWKLKVNDKETPFEKVNIGFIGILLDKGRYNIELEYYPPLLQEGWIGTLAAIALFITLVFVTRKRNEKHKT